MVIGLGTVPSISCGFSHIGLTPKTLSENTPPGSLARLVTPRRSATVT